MESFVQKLRDEGVLQDKNLTAAFTKILRADFVPAAIRDQANEDQALPTFEDQTISQPYTVAFMLEQLDVRPGQRILDVGSGSGWVTALLAELAGPQGRVWGVERAEGLVEFSSDNLKKYACKNLKIILGDGTKGLPKHSPFDRIHVAAAAKKIPPALKGQLAIGGKMIIPTAKNDIRLIERISGKQFREKVFPGFVFVPLISIH